MKILTLVRPKMTTFGMLILMTRAAWPGSASARYISYIRQEIKGTGVHVASRHKYAAVAVSRSKPLALPY